MGRKIAGVVGGLVAWIVVATILNWLMRAGWPGYAPLGVVLLAVFVPVHYMLWDKFPVWCHAVFRASLSPLALLGVQLTTSRRAEGPAS